MLDPIPEQNFPKGPFIGLYSAQESKESSARQFSPSSFRTTTKFHIVDACHLRWTAHVRSRQEPKVTGLRSIYSPALHDPILAGVQSCAEL